MRRPLTTSEDANVCPDDFEAVVSDWKTLVSDDDAVYDKVIRMDVSDLAPMVTWGPILLWEWTLRLLFQKFET